MKSGVSAIWRSKNKVLKTFQFLRKTGIIGLNERNVKYVSEFNPRRLHRLVNNKIETKALALRAHIPVPALLGTIESGRDIGNLAKIVEGATGFVIKPAQGAQGNGILVIDGPVAGGWRLANGRRITKDRIRFHVNNIMSGMYSLGGQPDIAMVEYRVNFDPLFDDVSFKGVPDIRIIVLKGFAVAAMVRLPTADSDGKANLHKGGVGVGVDLPTGITTTAMQYDRPIDLHPDTGQSLSGIQIPNWDDVLLMAARAYDVTGLGYLGVDVVLDRDKGPLLLELNARPGISIQIANGAGLRTNLEAIAKRQDDKVLTAEKRIALSKEMFSEAQPSDSRDGDAAPVEADPEDSPPVAGEPEPPEPQELEPNEPDSTQVESGPNQDTGKIALKG